VLGFTVLPLLRLSSTNRRVGIARVQRAVSWSMRLHVSLMKWFGVCSYEVRGLEKLKAHGQFVIANHPTLIDVVILVGLMPEVDCIVKQALWRNVFLRWPVYWAGYISNATGEGLVAACAERLLPAAPTGVPGGYAHAPGGRWRCSGRAQIALAAHVPLRPITITCDPITLFKGMRGSACRRARPLDSHGGRSHRSTASRPRASPHGGAAPHPALTRWFESSIERQLTDCDTKHGES
jgi:hypothetical protein